MEDFLHDKVEPVGGFGLGSTRLPGHDFCNFRLFHPASTLTTRKSGSAYGLRGEASKSIIFSWLK